MKKSVEIKLLPGEVWWGGAVHDGTRMPYGGADDAVAVNLTNLLENSGAPFLVSNRGRFLWLDQPFSFVFRSGIMSIESEEEIVRHSEGFANLPGAYRQASRQHFPAQGACPIRSHSRRPNIAHGWKCTMSRRRKKRLPTQWRYCGTVFRRAF
ncbi:hypothetical protein [Gordoniibacillus kamchatkensis]|uniref:hypothetical protein n=1 Tax=Gordoniibacillus kamchatkensis TaxID=1590651 RepID=UPI001E575FC3|nr:hypothetical protein [Paenibacillus sp. VKM B-2647]